MGAVAGIWRIAAVSAVSADGGMLRRLSNCGIQSHTIQGMQWHSFDPTVQTAVPHCVRHVVAAIWAKQPKGAGKEIALLDLLNIIMCDSSAIGSTISCG